MVIQKIIDAIKQMNIVELKELLTALQTEFNITLGVQMPASVNTSPGVIQPVEPEQVSFSVQLDGISGNKINVIKVIREIISLNLRDAKDFVESAPKLVKADLTKDEAQGICDKLTLAGAEASVV